MSIEPKNGRCKGCEYCKPLNGGDWGFWGCYHEPYRGKWVCEIKDCPKVKGADDENVDVL